MASVSSSTSPNRNTPTGGGDAPKADDKTTPTAPAPAQNTAAANTPATTPAKSDGFERSGRNLIAGGSQGAAKQPDLNGATPGEPPKNTKELRNAFSSIAHLPEKDQEAILKDVQLLNDDNASEADKALATLRLASKIPPAILKDGLGRIGIVNSTVNKILDKPNLLKNGATALDPSKPAAERIAAALSFAGDAATVLPKGTLKGVAEKISNGLPAAAKLTTFIGTLTDDKKTVLDKAKAAVDFAQELAKTDGKVFKDLAPLFKDAKGPLAVAKGALTLADPNASVADKAAAALSIWGNAKDAQAAGKKLVDWLKEAGVPNADQVAAEAAKPGAAAALVPGEVSKSVDPKLLEQLSPEDAAKLAKAGEDEALKETLPKLLEKVKSPEDLKALVSALGEGPGRKELVETLSKMEPEALGRVLEETVDGKPMVKVLEGVLAKLPSEEARKAVAKMLPEFESGGAKAFLKFAENVEGKQLGKVLEAVDKFADKLGGAKGVGKLLEAAEKAVTKAGVKFGPEVAAKLISHVAKIIPIAGAVPAAVDAVRMGKIAADTSLPGEIRFLAGTNALLNGTDAAVSVLDALGVTDVVGLPVAVGLSVAEFGLELTVDHMMDQAKKGEFKPSKELDAVIAGVALATSPAGEALLVGCFGPVGAQRVMLALPEVVADKGIDAAREGGTAAAKGTGLLLHGTAEDINRLADIVRNPEKYGKMAKVLVQGAVQQLEEVAKKGGALAKQAVDQLKSVAADLKAKGEKGLETLQWIASHPGEAGQVALNTLKDMAREGLSAATNAGKQLGLAALNTLDKVSDEVAKAAKSGAAAVKQYAREAANAVGETVNALAAAGKKGLDDLAWLAQHPGDAGRAAVKKLENLAVEGGELAKAAFDKLTTLGKQAGAAVEQVAKDLVKKGEQGFEMLQYIATHPSAVAKQVLNTAVNGVKQIAEAGGKLANAAADKLRQWADETNQLGQETRKAVLDLIQKGGNAANQILDAWKTNLTQGGREVIAAVRNLGDAAAGQLSNLAQRGGQLAEASLQHLRELAQAGSQSAIDAVANLARAGGPAAQGALDIMVGMAGGPFALKAFHALEAQGLQTAQFIEKMGANAWQLAKDTYDREGWTGVAKLAERLSLSAAKAVIKGVWDNLGSFGAPGVIEAANLARQFARYLW